MIGNKERFRLCQGESFCVSRREEAGRCEMEVRQQWEASRREAAEEGLFVAGEICKGKNISGRDGPLPYRLGRLKNEGHNSRRH